MKAYIWDLDGTLLDSYGSIVSSLVSVARACGTEDEREEILKAVKQGSVSGRGRAGRQVTEKPSFAAAICWISSRPGSVRGMAMGPSAGGVSVYTAAPRAAPKR